MIDHIKITILFFLGFRLYPATREEMIAERQRIRKELDALLNEDDGFEYTRSHYIRKGRAPNHELKKMLASLKKLGQ